MFDRQFIINFSWNYATTTTCVADIKDDMLLGLDILIDLKAQIDIDKSTNVKLKVKVILFLNHLYKIFNASIDRLYPEQTTLEDYMQKSK